MKNKPFIFILFALLIFGCRHQQEQVEKALEDGVEVVLNHIDPHQIDRQSLSLKLEEVMILDTEDSEVVVTGLVDINAFQVDSGGNIYILSHRGENHFFYKFTPEGKFERSFGRKGQGPGEMEYPLLPRMLPQDRLSVTDVLKKLMVFDKEGEVISEIRIDPAFVIVNPLENGNFIAFWKAGADDAASKHFKEKVSLFNPDEKEIQQLDMLRIAKKIYFLDPIFSWHLGENRIYHINEQRGYEILIYDHEGSLIRKIRKQYNPVRLRADTKEALLEGLPDKPQLRDPAIIPDHLPPVHAIFSDDEGRLYAVTFEKGERQGEYWCDIFNHEG
ncbi:MAG: 6-bladed beta-propeller, partial [Candidatus Aminicenantes bacterium]